MTQPRMNWARVIIVAMLVIAVAMGAAIYYLQEYYYYREIGGEVSRLPFALATGGSEDLAIEGFRGIDSDSSPIRARACFTLPPGEAARLRPYPAAEPLNGPRWFDCFDAQAIGAALESGEAVPVLSEAGVHPGVDRVVAVYPDGRAFAWSQIDPCGELVEADERPASCPPIPEGS